MEYSITCGVLLSFVSWVRVRRPNLLHDEITFQPKLRMASPSFVPLPSGLQQQILRPRPKAMSSNSSTVQQSIKGEACNQSNRVRDFYRPIGLEVGTASGAPGAPLLASS